MPYISLKKRQEAGKRGAKKLIDSRFKKGVCHKCGLRPPINPLKRTSQCQECLEKIPGWNAKYREPVISYYGGKCVCCGETESKFLELHHVNGDGKAHRERIGVSGTGMYRHLISNNFQSEWELQILCANCHKAVTYYGSCPHTNFLNVRDIN